MFSATGTREARNVKHERADSALRRAAHRCSLWRTKPVRQGRAGATTSLQRAVLHGYHVTVIQSFADQTTVDLFRERATKAARRIPVALWPGAKRKLKMLDVAPALGDLRSLPGNRLEALKGDQRGRHSLRINAQFRLTFRWEGNHAHEVRCEDYHS